MARITVSDGPSNEPLLRYAEIHAEGRAEPSPGISSSTSGSKPEWSGISGTTGHPSPAPTAESPSSPDPVPLHPSSTADSMDGSGQETGSSPSSPSDSSEDSAAPREATPVLVQEASLPTEQIMAMAREAYFDRNFAESERLLNIAETLGEDPTAIASARGYVAEARARSLATAPPAPDATGGGFGEEDPSAGGALVP